MRCLFGWRPATDQRCVCVLHGKHRAGRAVRACAFAKTSSSSSSSSSPSCLRADRRRAARTAEPRAKHNPDLIMCRKQPGICARARVIAVCFFSMRAHDAPPHTRAHARTDARSPTTTATPPPPQPSAGCARNVRGFYFIVGVRCESQSLATRQRHGFEPRAHTHTHTPPDTSQATASASCATR